MIYFNGKNLMFYAARGVGIVDVTISEVEPYTTGYTLTLRNDLGHNIDEYISSIQIMLTDRSIQTVTFPDEKEEITYHDVVKVIFTAADVYEDLWIIGEGDFSGVGIPGASQITEVVLTQDSVITEITK